MFDREIWRRCRLFILIGFLSWVPVPSQAKTAGLNAIAVYPGSNGQNQAQIANFILDQKNELYLCAGAGNIDKSGYRKLNKVTLAVGMTLERNAHGVLMLSGPSQPAACVVPGNLKLEKDQALSPSQLADQATIEGTVLPGSDPPIAQMPPLKAGIMIVFVASPDVELANFLRAQRQNDIDGWQRYLAANAGGQHAQGARKMLSDLYLKAGNADFQAYVSSKSTSQADYSKLADARHMADQAHEQVADDSATADLSKRVHAEVLELSRQSAAKLDLYRTALKGQTAGYVNLLAAAKFADGAYLVDPSITEASSAEQQSKLEQSQLDKALRQTEQQIAAERPDDAALTISPYQAFKDENPKISADLKSIVSLWIARAKKSQSGNDWQGAVDDLQKAQAMAPSPDTASLLAAVQQQAHLAANQAAVQAALQKSQDAQAAGDPVTAFEVLFNLPPEQKSAVTDKLQALQEDYVKAAEQQAAELKKASEPINGPADERGIVTAYGLTERCFELTEDSALKNQRDVLAADLTAFYLSQGKKYAEKPDGIGLNIAWAYLTEALYYSSAVTSGDVRDQRAGIQAKYKVKSRLSMRVEFRDPTSRRDVVDFANQLTDAVANGLESLGQQVYVLSASGDPLVPPNFQLQGAVTQHDLRKEVTSVSKQSKFRNGYRPESNPEWVKMNQDIGQVREDLGRARAQLQEAQSHNKKKEMEAAQKLVSDQEQKLKNLNDKFYMVQQTNMVPIEDPYTYMEYDIRAKPVVEIKFRIADSSGTDVVPEVAVIKENSDESIKREGVNQTDTQGVQPTGMEKTDADFYRTSEYSARDALVAKARDTVQGLPAILLQHADQKAAGNDFDGAAELYLLYLSTTPNADTPERKKAKEFLMKQFNFGDLAFPALAP